MNVVDLERPSSLPQAATLHVVLRGAGIAWITANAGVLDPTLRDQAEMRSDTNSFFPPIFLRDVQVSRR